MKKSLQLLLVILLVVATQAMGQTWPKFRNSLDQTGYTNAPGPYSDDILWEFWDNMSPIVSSPAVVNGNVYFGSVDSTVYCLDGITGSIVWKYKTSGGIYYSSPAISNGKLYIGSWDGHMYCLDAVEGTHIWDFNTGTLNGFNSCPSVVDGKVYFGSNNSRVYCLDAETGTVIWSYLTGMSVWCSPAVVDGRVYIGSFDNKMYCLDAATGDSIWATSCPMIIYSSPAVADGKLYFGSIVGGVAYCLNTADGAIVWSKSLYGAIFASPAVHNGKVFFGVDQVSQDMKGSMYCLDAATGDSIWCNSHFGNGTIYASPVINDSLIFYGSCNSTLYCARQSTGEMLWENDNYTKILTSPALVEDRIYFATDDGRFVCLSGSVGTDEFTLENSDIHLYPNPSNGDVKLDISLDESADVLITLYNISGERIITLPQQQYIAGTHTVNISARLQMKLSPGIYFCKLAINRETRVEKVIIY